jgi:hypothetical protein
VQVHPGELWVSKQRVHIVVKASKSAGAKGGVPKICGFGTRCTRANAFPVTFQKISGFVRVILKGNFKQLYRPKVSIF